MLGLLVLCGAVRAQQDAPITLDVDATEAPRRLLHARLTLPVKPGPLTLCYPKWMPGEHGPTGPIVNLSGLKLSAGGKPVGGIENAGWRLVYTDQPNENIKTAESVNQFVDCRFTLGIGMKEDGTITDVIAGTSAAQARLGPGMKLIAVNSRKYNADLLHEAITNSKAVAEPIELLTENGEFYKTYRLDYHGGDRCPHLERDATKPDLLLDILKPHASETRTCLLPMGMVLIRLLKQSAPISGGAAH
jgi:hypothetical protein